MALAATVVIVRAEHLSAIRRRMSEAPGVAVISEADTLSLQDTILAQPPEHLVLHSTFATTSRGATLVSGLKAGPKGASADVRVFIEDEDRTPLILAESEFAAARALHETSRPLDRAGTRQAARYPMNRRKVAVNGEAAQLVDPSVSGAQVQVPMRARPSQVVRMILRDEGGDIRVQATVAWAFAVPSGGAIHYRAGVEFVAPDRVRLAAYCSKFGGTPDPTFAQR
jgi:hypothetical protein